jgi:catechol 2,3-dioxygenase-like lactoylglutathione lyase family enzyme
MTKNITDKIEVSAPSKVGQIGIVVRDTRRAAEYFSRIYNIKPWYRGLFVEEETFYRGSRIPLELEVLIGFCGGVEIELIQMKNDVQNIYSDILKKQDGGMHHIGFFVNGLDKKVAEAKALGAEPLQWGMLKTKGGAVTRYVYFDTVQTCGTVTEYIETKFLGLSMPHMHFMVKVSALTGDVERINVG